VWTETGVFEAAYTWTRKTPSSSCLGTWSDGGHNTVVITASAITGTTSGGWYPAVVSQYAPGSSSGGSGQCCGAGVASLHGKVSSLVELEMTINVDAVEITMTGPANVWFGVGWFSQAMEDKPYAIIIDGEGGVTERQLASHMGSAASPGGKPIAPSVTVVHSSVHDGKRTGKWASDYIACAFTHTPLPLPLPLPAVVLTRPAVGASAQHANFSLQNTLIPIINALGSSAVFTYHKNKTASSISLWPAQGRGICLCEHPAALFGSAKGNIKYIPTGEEFGFINGCTPEPRESILANRNPTCDVRAYVGGLQVCKHKWSLLDADQAQPWPNQPLVYWQKYR